MFKTKLWRGLCATFAFLTAVVASLFTLLVKWEGQVNVALGIKAPTQEVTDDTNYYASDYTRDDDGYVKMREASESNEKETMKEGAVLVKNADNALPVASSARRVTLFGRAAADPVYRGNSGGPNMEAQADRQINFKKALENHGFTVNSTVYDALAASPVRRVKVAVENDDGVKSSIGEVPVSFYDAYASSYASDYNDAAIVLFARDAGEGRDLFMNDADGVSQLALHKEEADLLKMIKASGKFERTIVIINSAYPMELGFVDDEEYGVDACLWIGGPGVVGFDGVGAILAGDADPSGHFVDTYATDSLSSAAAQNSGDITFADKSSMGVLVQAEGIYVGYKYYETRYYDQVKGLHNATSEKGAYAGDEWDYAAEIAYPFGYGLSYARFTQTLDSLVWDKATHTVKASVTVTHNGYPGGTAYSGKSKSVVQLYASLPWEHGQAEKSAIQLVDFGKTELLGAGESDTVELEFSDYIFATYDENATNGADATKKGCYVFDAGDYAFAIGDDCHDALNNVLAAQGAVGMTDRSGNAVAGDAEKAKIVKLDAYDNTTYATSDESGETVVVCNRFGDIIDVNKLLGADTVTYMTRADWNTFPVTYDSLPFTAAMQASMANSETYVKPSDAPSYGSFTQGADVTLKLVEMRDVPFDDPRWETFIDQLSVSDMCAMLGENFGQPAVAAVGKNANNNCDGPAGPQNGYVGKTVRGIPTVRVNEVVAASTFNKELIASRGDFIAEDCLFGGTTQIWSPGCNLHRTPFSGRNFEYYSEDAVMTYICSAVQCEAMQKKGCNAAPKHFMGNDQETNRGDVCQFWTEQALRQGPLKGFEGAFVKGGALATMMSFTRVGCKNLYATKELLTDVLRDEWGFKGVNITDSVAGWQANNNPTIACLAAGTDTFNARSASGSEIKAYAVKQKDGNILQAIRTANKRFFYAMSRSNLINGMTAEMEDTEFTPWWKPAITAVTVVLGVVAAAALGMMIASIVLDEKRKKEGDNDGAMDKE